jgi:hypothetical protein
MATIGREGVHGYAGRHRCRKLLLPASRPDSGAQQKWPARRSCAR